MNAPVPPTFGFDPTRPRSANFFQSPGYRGRIGGQGAPAPGSGLPPQMSGYYPGTAAHFEAGRSTAEAGAAYDPVKAWTLSFLSDYGAPESDLAYIRGLDWSKGSSLQAARLGLEEVLINRCSVPFGSGAAGVPPSVGAMLEAEPWNDALRQQVDSLITMYCPGFSLSEPEVITSPEPAQVVSDVTVPAPAPTAIAVAEDDRPRWGFVVGASLIGAALLGGAWYLSRKKKKPRRKNPSKAPNMTMLEHTYEHGFAEGFEAAERAFAEHKRENPCACQNPSKPKRRGAKKAPRRRNAPKPRRRNEYGGTGGFPSVQPDVYPDFTRTPLLATGTPGAGYAVPPGWMHPRAVEVLPNPWTALPTQLPSGDYVTDTWVFHGPDNMPRVAVQKESGEYTIKARGRTGHGRKFKTLKKAKGFASKKGLTKKRRSNPLPKGAACGRQVGKLTADKRRALPDTAFGLPERRDYPMPDTRHAAVAKGRAKQALKKRRLSRKDYNRIVRKADRILKSCGGL